MLSNDLIKLLFFCFLAYGSINNTQALHEKIYRVENILEHKQEPDGLHTGTYLVIGVFEYEKNARRLTEKATAEGLTANYKFYANTGFFYVYLYNDSSKEEVINVYHHIRDKTRYHDAWIFTVQDNTAQDNEVELPLEEQMVEQKIYPEASVSIAAQASIEEPEPASIQHLKRMVVAFEAINQETGDTINLDIKLVDGDKAKLIENLSNTQIWDFNKEELVLDTVQVIAQAIGYRKFQMAWSVSDPLNDTTNHFTSVRNDTFLVQLPLMELEAGDIQVMYNTYFYGNATVMRIQSKYELEELYKALNRNPGMRIKLHGHTNGNSRGLTYLYLEEKENFFELVRTKEYRKKGVSSSKLSTYRAETIKSYLVHRGIAPERIETEGWGGKKMLYEPDSPMAKNNIRVEIEVLTK